MKRSPPPDSPGGRPSSPDPLSPASGSGGAVGEGAPDEGNWYFLGTGGLLLNHDPEGAREEPSPEPEGASARRRSRSLPRRALLAGSLVSAGALAGGVAWRGAQSWCAVRDARNTSRPLANEEEYAAYLASLELRYLSPAEIIRPHRNVRGGVANELPPRRLWERIEPVLLVADEIRRRLGRRILLVNSAYRSPAYNAICTGAASRSQHVENRALDLTFDAKPSEAAEVAAELREEGFFQGGVGSYASFLHIDTRGRNATWAG